MSSLGTLNKNDDLTPSYVCKNLGVHTITCLNTCKKSARHAIIARLCFSYAEAYAYGETCPRYHMFV